MLSIGLSGDSVCKNTDTNVGAMVGVLLFLYRDARTQTILTSEQPLKAQKGHCCSLNYVVYNIQEYEAEVGNGHIVVSFYQEALIQTNCIVDHYPIT